MEKSTELEMPIRASKATTVLVGKRGRHQNDRKEAKFEFHVTDSGESIKNEEDRIHSKT